VLHGRSIRKRPDQDQYPILNLAIGGAWGGRKGVDDAAFPQRVEIDCVRVFKAEKPTLP
jgi:hypothetical protein